MTSRSNRRACPTVLRLPPSRRRAWAWTLAALALGALATCGLVTQPVATRPGRVQIPGDLPGRLESEVRWLCRAPFRTPRNVARLDETAAWISAQFAAAGGRVSEQVFQADGQAYRNVVARFGPRQGARVVVAAHYDVCGEVPGADDNASGVAGLLELARRLGASPPAGPVELVACTLEEPPHFRTPDMGSARHARALREAGVKVKAMLALDMIGSFTDAPGTEHFPLGLMGLAYPSRGNYLIVVGDLGSLGLARRVKKAMIGATQLPVRSMNAPRRVPGVDLSDHLSYWAMGYPALMVATSAFDRNPRYHRPGDLPETLDYRRMALAVLATEAAVRDLASVP